MEANQSSPFFCLYNRHSFCDIFHEMLFFSKPLPYSFFSYSSREGNFPSHFICFTHHDCRLYM